MSLKQKAEKIKGVWDRGGKPLFWLFFALLTIVDAYMLGYISKVNEFYSLDKLEIEQKEDIKITMESLDKNLIDATIDSNSDSGPIVASKNGTKYYFSWCSGVGRINNENKIYFNTEEEAQNSGYSIAKNCE